MEDPFILATLQAISNLLMEKVKLHQSVKDGVEKLRDQLVQLQWFLRDYKVDLNTDHSVLQWRLKFRDLAYDAEDLVEHYAFKAGAWRRRDDGPVRKCINLVKTVHLHHEVAENIQRLNQRISDLKADFQALGVRAIMEKDVGSSSMQQQLRRTYSFVDETDFVGLESDVELLTKHLVGKDGTGVVSITGMGGLGKTTIAKKVYQHGEVRAHFQGFSWISVSQQWKPKDILQKILSSLINKTDDQTRGKTEDELMKEVLNIQKRMRCLIVLDDVWPAPEPGAPDVWECIKVAFPFGPGGSKVLVTTRDEEVASRISHDGYRHEPRYLSLDESWELLRKKALRPHKYEQGHDANEMESLGKQMLKHCAGLPLAVIVLAGILLTKHSLKEWESVSMNIRSFLWKGKRIGGGKAELEKILGLSYHDLPSQLKPCFLYLALFPEDYDIDANTLYQLWIAEGLILRHDLKEGETMMELAEEYLCQLGQRGMVQLMAWKLPGMEKRYESCRVHDLMLDFCLIKVKQECFMKSINHSPEGKSNEQYDPSMPEFRRLVISGNVCQKLQMTKHLRVAEFKVEYPYSKNIARMINLQLYHCEMLRVLIIEGLSYPQDDTKYRNLPRAIGKLIHLRLLSLQNSHFLFLPSCLGNLKSLVTLDLRLGDVYFDGVWSLPNVLWKMKELTCLYLPGMDNKMQLYKSKIRLDTLSELEILENISDELYDIKDLFNMKNLRVLVVHECSSLENLEMIAIYAQSSTKLESLAIKTCCDFSKHMEKGLLVLQQLLLGKNIHNLFTAGAMWRFPSYEPGMYSNMVSLAIFGSGLDVEEIRRTTEQFPHLEDLGIGDVKGKEMCFHANCFLKLQSIEFHNFMELEKLVVEEGALLNLRSLSISEFPKLEEIPEGLRFIATLERLDIDQVSPEFQERIRTTSGQEGIDFRKISHVSVVRVDGEIIS